MKNSDSINNYLQKFDLVLLIINGSGTAKNLTESFLNSEAMQKAEKKVLVLSDQSIPYTNIYHQYCQLNTEELDAVRKIYFMYDFSDRFQVLSDNPQYGGILNFVKAGKMTQEAAFQTLLES